MKGLRALAALGALTMLGACASDPYGGGYGFQGVGGMGPKQTVGALGGAGVGALIGSQIGSGEGKLAAVAIGTLAGAFLGSQLGQSLDRADQQYAAQAQYSAVQYGQPYNWRNPQSGNYGTVQPGPAYASQYGGECRQYSHTVYIGGRPETAYGTACRQPDGTWRITNT